MIKSIREIDLEINQQQWLIKDIVPKDSISVICGVDGNKNAQTAIELALSIANGKDWHGKYVPIMQQVILITVDSPNKVGKRTNVWNKANQIHARSMLAVLNTPIDLVDKCQLRRLISDISYCNQREGNDEFPALIVVDIQGGLTNEYATSRLINSIDYLRSEIGCAFLLVFNEGISEESDSFIKLFNSADAVHRVTALDDDLAVRVRCLKMKAFAKPNFIELKISCAESSLVRGL